MRVTSGQGSDFVVISILPGTFDEMKTLYYIFPEIKAFGCCHEVFGTQKLLRDICEKECGLPGIDWHEIHVNVLGINHFTFGLTSVDWRKEDLRKRLERSERPVMIANTMKYLPDGWERR